MFLVYTSLSLCRSETDCRSIAHGEVGHQMGLKSNQMVRIVCVAWIRLLGIPRNVEGRNKMGFKEGTFIAPKKSSVSFFKSVDILLRYYCCLLPTFVKRLRELAIIKRFTNVSVCCILYTYRCNLYILYICLHNIIFNPL